MANDKTKPTEGDIAPKHAKAPRADASGTGDSSHKKRPQIAALVVLLVVLVCAAIAGGAYLCLLYTSHDAACRTIRHRIYVSIHCHYRLFLHTILSTTPV